MDTAAPRKRECSRWGNAHWMVKTPWMIGAIRSQALNAMVYLYTGAHGSGSETRREWVWLCLLGMIAFKV